MQDLGEHARRDDRGRLFAEAGGRGGRQRRALRYGVPVYSDYRRMLDESGCDFVSICTLHDTHAAEAIAAAERGKHFIVEKPICLTPEDLFAVRHAVDKSGVRAFVGFQEFHYGQLQATIEAVHKGWLGRVHLAEIEYFNGIGPWVRQHWWARTKKIGGSSMLFCGCHPLMMMMLVMKGVKVEEVQAFATMSSAKDFAALEYPATQVNLIRFEDGRIGKVTSCLDSLESLLLAQHADRFGRHPDRHEDHEPCDAAGSRAQRLAAARRHARSMMRATSRPTCSGRCSSDSRQPAADAPMPYSGFDEAWECTACCLPATKRRAPAGRFHRTRSCRQLRRTSDWSGPRCDDPVGRSLRRAGAAACLVLHPRQVDDRVLVEEAAA